MRKMSFRPMNNTFHQLMTSLEISSVCGSCESTYLVIVLTSYLSRKVCVFVVILSLPKSASAAVAGA